MVSHGVRSVAQSKRRGTLNAVDGMDRYWLCITVVADVWLKNDERGKMSMLTVSAAL